MNKNQYLLSLNLRRRSLVIGAAVWPALTCIGNARAQAPARMRRIGLLATFSASDFAEWNQDFLRGLRDLGWIEGKNISIEYRYADGAAGRLAELASDLARLNLDVLVAATQSDSLALRKVAGSTPVVMAAPGDPVTAGLVDNLARPGGNITGLTQIAPELAGKRLELVKELVPKLAKVAVLWNPQGDVSPLSWKELQAPAQKLAIQLQSQEVRMPQEFDKVFQAIAAQRAEALFVISHPLMVANRKRIVDFALKLRLPSVFQFSEYVEAGGLASYGPDRSDMFRRTATYVHKILNGTKPGELPIEQPTKFELIVNLKTAKALGITIPQSVMVRATKVIE